MSSDLLRLLQAYHPLPQHSASFSRQKRTPPPPSLRPPAATISTLNSSSSCTHSSSTILKVKLNGSSSLATRSVVTSAIGSNFNAPLISPHDNWGNWTALFAAAAFGIWSERTKIGSTLSGSLVSILVGLAASNVGIVSSEASAYGVVLQFLLPLAVPLLLFRADLRRVIKSTGTLLLAFLLGSGFDSSKVHNPGECKSEGLSIIGAFSFVHFWVHMA
ncbi:hypothetical protein PIB30_073648, partial [Stylosanthes scabra]|nr:hypothetical protein [Stylosanthes scabra]